jgi:hypothetical protein
MRSPSVSSANSWQHFRRTGTAPNTHGCGHWTSPHIFAPSIHILERGVLPLPVFSSSRLPWEPRHRCLTHSSNSQTETHSIPTRYRYRRPLHDALVSELNRTPRSLTDFKKRGTSFICYSCFRNLETLLFFGPHQAKGFLFELGLTSFSDMESGFASIIFVSPNRAAHRFEIYRSCL